MIDTRGFAIPLAVAVAAGAALALHSLNPETRPERLAFDHLHQQPADLNGAIGLYSEALRRDAANPYRWADLAETLQRAGRTGEARACFRRALALSRKVPQIWIRNANFHLDLGETGPALESAGLVLGAAGDYDGFLFSALDRYVPDPAQ